MYARTHQRRISTALLQLLLLLLCTLLQCIMAPKTGVAATTITVYCCVS
jgi:hypothetical protein